MVFGSTGYLYAGNAGSVRYELYYILMHQVDRTKLLYTENCNLRSWRLQSSLAPRHRLGYPRCLLSEPGLAADDMAPLVESQETRDEDD